MNWKIKWGFPLLVILLSSNVHAQVTLTALEKVQKCIEKYEAALRLGPGYSNEMRNETINEFKSIFEGDAVLYWDLYKSDTLKSEPMNLRSYIDSALSVYEGNQPKASIVKTNIKLDDEGKRATVYLVKHNDVTTSEDKSVVINIIKLKLLLNIYDTYALIQNIEEDTRPTTIRSLSADFGYIAWNNIDQELGNTAVSILYPDNIGNFSIDKSLNFIAGISLEIRLDRKKFNGLTLETGLSYSQSYYNIIINRFEDSYRDTLDISSSNPWECSIFDRSEQIEENIQNITVMVPVIIKYYFKPSWFYLRGGPIFGYKLWDSDVHYELSHTGGGHIVNLSTGNQSYISQENEFYDNGSTINYGLFNSKTLNFNTRPDFSQFNVSFLIGTGFELNFSHIVLALEPSLLFGQNAFSSKNSNDDYLLSPEGDYTSFLRTVDLPRYSLSGMVMFRFSYLFLNR